MTCHNLWSLHEPDDGIWGEYNIPPKTDIYLSQTPSREFTGTLKDDTGGASLWTEK